MRDHNISQVIDPADEMVDGNVTHYFKVGQSALQNINQALAVANIEPKRILDLPCGHGRVLRHLTAQFPEASITACDLDSQAVDFCAKTFGVRGVYSSKNVSSLDMGEKYDLIWCGSLLTHLDQAPFIQWLEFFSRHLAEDGIALFTTHGRFVQKKMSSGQMHYGLDTHSIITCLKSCLQSGFGYANYPDSNDYGVSLSLPSWVLRQLQSLPELSLISFREQGWDGHQDVVVIQKRSDCDEPVSFDEAFYLEIYDDVRQAVATGHFNNGYEHFIHHGREEGRAPSLSAFVNASPQNFSQ